MGATVSKIIRRPSLLAGIAIVLGLCGCQAISFAPNPVKLEKGKTEEVKATSITSGVIKLTMPPRIGGANAAYFEVKEEAPAHPTRICKVGLEAKRGESCWVVIGIEKYESGIKAVYELEGEGIGTFSKVESVEVKQV
jgi:hypothetical protein